MFVNPSDRDLIQMEDQTMRPTMIAMDELIVEDMVADELMVVVIEAGDEVEDLGTNTKVEVLVVDTLREGVATVLGVAVASLYVMAPSLQGGRH